MEFFHFAFFLWVILYCLCSFLLSFRRNSPKYSIGGIKVLFMAFLAYSSKTGQKRHEDQVGATCVPDESLPHSALLSRLKESGASRAGFYINIPHLPVPDSSFPHNQNECPRYQRNKG
jgi:hypothetical protein